MKIRLTALLTLASAGLFTADTLAARAAEPRLQEYNLPADHLALKGYDPVGYLTDRRAEKGEPSRQFEHHGVVYRFSSAEHLAAFKAAPEHYLPAYGGWCATAMAKGDKVDIDPENFKVTGGRVFLFYKGVWGDARTRWEKDEPAQTAKADAQWKKIAGE